jgi:phosphotransferase system IIA component
LRGRDEPTTPAAERPASFQVAAKIAGFVEELDRVADTLFALLLPGEGFWLQRGSRK